MDVNVLAEVKGKSGDVLSRDMRTRTVVIHVSEKPVTERASGIDR